MEKQTMGAFISALRKSKGITQKELAQLLNVSDKAVSRWECDQTTPDIYLLPMIADIFDVTVDELIRGGKIKNEQPTETQEKNIQKRLESIFVSKFNSYKTKSIIPLVITIVGFIIACILREMAYYEIGIGVSIILFICSIACQIFFLLNFKNSINTSDINSDIIAQYKRKIFDFSFWIFTFLFSIEALIISIDPNFFSWCGPVCAIAVLLISKLVKSLIVKKLNFPLLENEKQNSKLFIKVFISFVCIISVLVASMITINVNCDKWIEKPEVFYVTDSTKVIENYIENQLLNGYGQCDYPLNDEEIDNEIKVTITDNDILFSDVIEYSCFIKRFDISDVERNGKSCKEVKLWTVSTKIKSRSILDNINIVYIILYFVSAITAIGIYIIKSKKK